MTKKPTINTVQWVNSGAQHHSKGQQQQYQARPIVSPEAELAVTCSLPVGSVHARSSDSLHESLFPVPMRIMIKAKLRA